MNKLLLNRPLAAFVLLTFCVSVGCSSVRTVPVSSDAEQRRAIADLNGAVAGKKPTVALVSTAELRTHEVRTWEYVESKWTAVATELKVVPDSVFWLDSATRESHQVSWPQVETIKLVDHGRGALEGLGIGLLLGAALGALLGYTQGDDPPGWFAWSKEEKAALGAIYIGALGGLVGLLVGAGTGHKHVYRFEHPTNTGERIP